MYSFLIQEFRTIDEKGDRVTVQVYRKTNGEIEVNVSGNTDVWLNQNKINGGEKVEGSV